MSFNVNASKYLLAEVVCFQDGLGFLLYKSILRLWILNSQIGISFLMDFAWPSKHGFQLLRLREPSADGLGELHSIRPGKLGSLKDSRI